MNDTIPIAEIFGPTIQGEGAHVGMKCIFVRVCGCDFNCSWCDSKFAWTANKNTIRYTPFQLFEKLSEQCALKGVSHIVLTGGNPCLYNFYSVITALKDLGIKVDVETQGSKLPDWLNECDLITFSPKPPSSNQKDVYNELTNWIKYKTSYNHPIIIKIPIFNEEDFKFAEKYNEFIKSLGSSHNVSLYLSVGNPETDEEGDISKRVLDDYRKLIDRVNNSKLHDVYILPQMHTLLWGNKQGV